ncbi:hypothetical protein AM427_004930 [Escherichia coli]|jgi:hypothetical protein|nr:hypothetical protein AM427_004930 [Escherichia coli]GDD39200.1 hypothetical protein HmCmsJML242_03218 [Escherichia coli]CAK6617014.1 hypothetical protein KP4482023_26895 [Klebsiella pneumoniae]CDK49634.1 hypothetical protein [Escherichia coli IS5]CHQ03068.1 Uncharacterised protein [Salmonella enterica subsp. enterica serovar Typhi]
MYLREPQFHLKNSKLAEVFNTIFNDLIVGRQDVETLETELYSYDIYVKNTILTVFIFRAEIVSLLGEKDVEVLGFCYPRELEQKIIDVSVNKNYQTVFKVPNGIKDLETVEVRNLRLQSPGFSELYSRFFINPHYYILNAYPVHCDPKLTFVEPAPLTPEQEVEAAAYDRFCLHDLPKFEKAKTSLIKEMGVAFSRIPEMYGRFRLKRKDPTTDLLSLHLAAWQLYVQQTADSFLCLVNIYSSQEALRACWRIDGVVYLLFLKRGLMYSDLF